MAPDGTGSAGADRRRTWMDGARLPNETRLGEMLGVSRITIRHALRNLEEWGLLRREQGRGTFVRTSTVIAGFPGPTSFTQEMADRGFTAASRVLELREMPGGNEIASALEVREGDRGMQDPPPAVRRRPADRHPDRLSPGKARARPAG